MMQRFSDNSDTSSTGKKLWYQAATTIAVITGATALIVISLISLSLVKHSIVEPEREKELEQLKIIIVEQPTNEQVLNLIRELDLRIRRDKVNRLAFTLKGCWLLLISLAIFFSSLKWIVVCRKKVPLPEPESDRQKKQALDALLSRRAITAGLGFLILLAIILAVQPHVDFKKASLKKTGSIEVKKPPTYPSFEKINRNWPGFRGPGGNGVSAYTNIPVSFDVETGKNINFKTKVPLGGFNSPIVWDGKAFVSGADENNRQVYCFDALSGKLLWTGDMTNLPGPKREPPDVMEDTGFAASTMVTNGIGAFAIFATGDIGGFDLDGKRIWLRYFGTPDSAYGYASSLAMYQNLVLVQFDQGMAEDQKSKIIALDASTGKTVWETMRPIPNSWTSPVVAKIEDKYQIITAGDPWVIAYNPTDGKELWRVDCLGTDVAPSPVYSNGFVFATKPYSDLVAIRPDGQDDVTKTHIAWKAEDGIPDICSPVSNGELVFLLTTEGTLTCYKLQDGAKIWEKDLDGSFNASPSLVGDQLYLLSIEGVLYVLKAGIEYKEISKSKIGEECFASPAFMDGRMYIRTVEHIYCIENKD